MKMRSCLAAATALAMFSGCSVVDRQPDALEPDPARPVIAARDEDDSFRFLVVADTHAMVKAPGGGVRENQEFAPRLGFINSIDADFSIIVGDVIDGHAPPDQLERMWDGFDHIARKFRKRFFKVPGNHDIWDVDSERIWRERFGPTFYSFSHKDCHFVVLNSEDQTAPQRIDGEQLAWLAADLERSSTARRVFVFVHQPLWTYESNWHTHVHPLLANHGVDTVFSGHWHQYVLFPTRDGVRYVSASSVARENPEALGGFPSVLPVNVEGRRSSFTVLHPSGQEMPAYVVTPEAVESARELVKSLPVAAPDVQGSTSFEVTIQNPLGVSARAVAAVLGDGTPWGSNKTESLLAAGQAKTATLETRTSGRSFPLPEGIVDLHAGDVRLLRRRFFPNVTHWASTLESRVLDDFEDGDLRHRARRSGIASVDGAWTLRRDASQPPHLLELAVRRTALPGARSNRALRLSAPSGAALHPLVVLDVLLSEQPGAADLSGSVGITFLAKSDQRSKVRFAVEGAFGSKRTTCTSTAHGSELTLSEDFAAFVIYWHELRQPQGACPWKHCVGPFVTDQIESLCWSVEPSTSGLDVWLDDVSILYERQ
jgi:predicted phosphodiesterase